MVTTPNFLKALGTPGSLVEVSLPEPNMTGRPLKATEAALFEADWEALRHAHGRLGDQERFFGERLKAAVRSVLGIELLKRGQVAYDGKTPSGGLGMQPIHFADVTNTAANTAGQPTNGMTNTWDINWAGIANATNWQGWWGAPQATHVAGTALGPDVATNAYGGTTRRVVSRDANNVEWGVLLWGLYDLHPSPKIFRIRVDQGVETVGDHDFEAAMRNTRDKAAPLGRLYYFTSPQPFAVGVNIRALIGSSGFGVSTLKPVGCTIASAQRLRLTAANERPGATAI